MAPHCIQANHYNILMKEYDDLQAKAPLSHSMVEHA